MGHRQDTSRFSLHELSILYVGKYGAEIHVSLSPQGIAQWLISEDHYCAIEIVCTAVVKTLSGPVIGHANGCTPPCHRKVPLLRPLLL